MENNIENTYDKLKTTLNEEIISNGLNVFVDPNTGKDVLCFKTMEAFDEFYKDID